MLSARWKQGGSSSTAPQREPLRAGQIRSFRIALIDAASKTIELELDWQTATVLRSLPFSLLVRQTKW